jgi:hypothetical protein
MIKVTAIVLKNIIPSLNIKLKLVTARKRPTRIKKTTNIEIDINKMKIWLLIFVPFFHSANNVKMHEKNAIYLTGIPKKEPDGKISDDKIRVIKQNLTPNASFEVLLLFMSAFPST